MTSAYFQAKQRHRLRPLLFLYGYYFFYLYLALLIIYHFRIPSRRSIKTYQTNTRCLCTVPWRDASSTRRNSRLINLDIINASWSAILEIFMICSGILLHLIKRARLVTLILISSNQFMKKIKHMDCEVQFVYFLKKVGKYEAYTVVKTTFC